jgi:solute carrier family 25 (mitochondrial carnitine/acylcarnitine transporter), member 20/29
MSAEGESVEQQKGVPLWKSFLSGTAGGWGLVLAGHPLDTMKVRLQTSSQYKGMGDCLMQTIRAEGVRGLYKGVIPPLGGVGFMYAVCFFGYGVGKNLVRNDGQKDGELNMFQLWNAGMVSGVFTTAVMVPMEQVKIRMQIDGQGGAAKKYNGFADVVRALYREGGMRSLYRGTGLTLLRDCPGSGAYFAGYEYFKRLGVPEGGTLKDVSKSWILFSGGMAGICNWLISLPPDTLKSRVQGHPDKYKSGLDCFRQLMRNEGPSALFRGFAPIMVRAFPANAACFFCAELALRALDRF